MQLIMRDFKATVVEPNKNVQISFTLEDSGPGSAWEGKPAVVVTKATALQGQLYIEARIQQAVEAKAAPAAAPVPPPAPPAPVKK
jgi:hypothetical protein